MTQKGERILFADTESAVSFGEGASLVEMGGLLERLYKVLMQKQIEIAVEMQLFHEAVHAFRGDEWYEGYLESRKKLFG